VVKVAILLLLTIKNTGFTRSLGTLFYAIKSQFEPIKKPFGSHKMKAEFY
jgi:hypothetical protein